MNALYADVAVLGTGVVGLATAHRLLADGHAVTLIGPRPPAAAGQASGAAGAMLSIVSEVDAGQSAARVELEVEQRARAAARYPAWLESLAASSGTAVPVATGTWVVAGHTESESLAAIAAAATQIGHAAEQHDAVDGMRPDTRAAGALWLPTEASLDITRLLTALAAAASAHRLSRWCDTTATHLDTGAPAVRIRCADGTRIDAGRVVLAAGAGIPALLGASGGDLCVPRLLAGRGVSLLVGSTLPVPHTVRTPNSGFACGTHLVPRGGGTHYLGATNRLSLDPDPATAATARLGEIGALVRDAARVLDRRLGAAALHRHQVGYRPYTVDHLPLVGPTADPRILLATATYRCGVLLAPLMADLLADELAEPGALDLHPYRATRPIPMPPLREVLTHRTARDLADHLTGGPVLGAGDHDRLVTLLTTTLPALLDREDAAATALNRLYNQAPVPEVLPALLDLATRREPTACPRTPSAIPSPRTYSALPASSATRSCTQAPRCATPASTPSTASH